MGLVKNSNMLACLWIIISSNISMVSLDYKKYQKVFFFGVGVGGGGLGWLLVSAKFG